MSFNGAARPGPNDSGAVPRPTRAELRKIVSGIQGVSPGVTFTIRRRPDGSFSFPFASPAFEQHYGDPREELARDASSVLGLIHRDDIDRVLATIAESGDKLDVWSCEFRISTPARGELWVEGRSVPQSNIDGSILWHGFLNDITERKKAEIAMQASEHRFRAYIENAPIAVMVVDRDGRIVDGNPVPQQLLGYDFTALANLTVFDLHRPEDRAEVQQRLDALSAGGRVDREVRWISRDGQPIWVLLRAVWLDDGQSIGFCQDITRRKHAELEVMRSRELLDAFIDHAPVGIAMFDRSLRYIRSSRSWQSVMGATEAVLAGRHHYEDFAAVPEKWMDAHRRALAGETVMGEDEWRPPGGKVVRSHWEVHPWGDAGTDTGGIIILFEDVTESRAMEAELRHAHKMEALGQLAGGVAHDFNNLLQIIQGYTELLHDQTCRDDTGRKYAAEVLKAARGASSLTRQLLAFSRKQVLVPAVIDLNEVVQSTSKMLKRLLAEDIHYRVELARPLWRVEADADQLSQVLINLCVNSRDAMPRGGSLTLATRNLTVDNEEGAQHPKLPTGDYAVLTVNDTGTGMDADVLEHIFEPFFTTKDTGKGTGLGLSTVYGIIRQSEGYVWAESNPGEGTCFTVCLPRTSKQVARATAPHDSLALRRDQTILVVEDDDDVRCAIADYLPALGYRVLVSHPSQALAVAEEHGDGIDLLLTDVVMPEISGPALAEKLRAVCPGLRTIFMSGYIDDAVVRHGVLESRAGFLQKPFTLSELTDKLRDSLATP